MILISIFKKLLFYSEFFRFNLYFSFSFCIFSTCVRFLRFSSNKIFNFISAFSIDEKDF